MNEISDSRGDVKDERRITVCAECDVPVVASLCSYECPLDATDHAEATREETFVPVSVVEELRAERDAARSAASVLEGARNRLFAEAEELRAKNERLENDEAIDAATDRIAWAILVASGERSPRAVWAECPDPWRAKADGVWRSALNAARAALSGEGDNQ